MSLAETSLSSVPMQQIADLSIGDINDIKRPPNAFIIFYRSLKAEMLRSNEAIPANEIDRMIGRMWQLTDEDTRSTYREQAKRISETFKNIHPDFIEPSPRRKKSTQSPKLYPHPINIRVILHPSSQELAAIDPNMTSASSVINEVTSNESVSTISDPLAMLKSSTYPLNSIQLQNGSQQQVTDLGLGSFQQMVKPVSLGLEQSQNDADVHQLDESIENAIDDQ